jgi:class 3 adenylate cyclase/predicted ATPase
VVTVAPLVTPKPTGHGLKDGVPLAQDSLDLSVRLHETFPDSTGTPGMDVSTWLRDLGLGDYAQAFQANHIDPEVLPRLTADDLIGLGITSVGHRRRLLDAIAALDQGRAAAAAKPIAVAVRPVEAERRQLTVLFCDLVGSTELARRLDPEDLREVMRAYQAACADVISRFEGHLARFLGDGVLAYFGWPGAHEDDAERAVRAGLQLVDGVPRLQNRPGMRLQARVGVATGQVVVGDLISEGASDKDAVSGETPNLAARLQALAAPGSVVISTATRRLIGGLFELADLGPQCLKGFAEPLSAFRVEGEGRAEGRFEALHGGQLTLLVGRDEELALLCSRWEQARDGEGQVVLLSGEPGIGKSRLIRELRDRIAAERHLGLTHQCSPYHQASPLHPIIEHLERAAGFERDDLPEARLAKLEALLVRGTDERDQTVPLIAALLGVPIGDRDPALTLTPEVQKRRTLQALVDQLAALAAERPVLALYEDVHWIDPSTLELLGLITERIRHLPVLALITFRPEFQPPWTGQAHMTTLTMSRLDRRQDALMVKQVVGAKALPAEVSAHIVAKTDGVPLFVEELTKAVLESGLIRGTDNRYVLAGPLPPLAIPATLHDSLLARLDRLAPVKEVAQIGAAIGREFSHALLSAVADRPEDQLRDALDQLVSSELVFRRGTPPDATYSFKHALVRDAAYSTLLKARRQPLHARIAKVLEDLFPETADAQPELLAHHCTEAASLEKAIQFRRKAAIRAASRYAHLEAIAHATQGLELIQRLPSNPARQGQALDLQSVLTQELARLKGYEADETVEAYRRLRELCEAGENSAQLRGALQALFGFHLLRFELEPARNATERLLELAQGQADVADQCNGHYQAGQLKLLLGNLQAAQLHLERVATLSAGHPTVVGMGRFHDRHVVAACYLSWTLFALGRPATALAKCKEAADLASRSFWHDAIGGGMAGWCVLQQLVGNAQAVREAAKVIVSRVPTSNPRYPPRAELLEIWGLAAAGKAQEALAWFLRSRVASHRAIAYSSYYLSVVAQILALAQQTGDALNVVNRALHQLERTGDRWFEAELHRIRGELLVALPKKDGNNAEACFRKALDVSRIQHARGWELRAATSLARLWADQGKRAQAHDLLAPVYGWFTEGFDIADLKDAKALLDELR